MRGKSRECRDQRCVRYERSGTFVIRRRLAADVALGRLSATKAKSKSCGTSMQRAHAGGFAQPDAKKATGTDGATSNGASEPPKTSQQIRQHSEHEILPNVAKPRDDEKPSIAANRDP